MKNWIKNWASILFLCFATVSSFAQSPEVAMATNFRKEGKIYVVIAVALILLIGVFVVLFRLEKRVKALEKEV